VLASANLLTTRRALTALNVNELAQSIDRRHAQVPAPAQEAREGWLWNSAEAGNLRLAQSRISDCVAKTRTPLIDRYSCGEFLPVAVHSLFAGATAAGPFSIEPHESSCGRGLLVDRHRYARRLQVEANAPPMVTMLPNHDRRLASSPCVAFRLTPSVAEVPVADGLPISRPPIMFTLTGRVDV
jgi:hypothetical protein